MRLLVASIVAVGTLMACALPAAAADPFTMFTLRPYLSNEINSLELNERYLESLLELDGTPTTLGVGLRAAPATYRRIDDGVTKAGLSKEILVVSIGSGHPASDSAWFLGLNQSVVRPTAFPNFLLASGDADTQIHATAPIC
jgi:hypothetical protein